MFIIIVPVINIVIAIIMYAFSLQVLNNAADIETHIV